MQRWVGARPRETAGRRAGITADTFRALARCCLQAAYLNLLDPFNPGVRYYPHFIDEETEVK